MRRGAVSTNVEGLVGCRKASGRLRPADHAPTHLQLGNTDLPETSPDLADAKSISVELLKTMHHVLLEVRPCRGLAPVRRSPFVPAHRLQIQVQDGSMVCPSCEHVFVIKEGIPNMVRPCRVERWSERQLIMTNNAALGRARSPEVRAPDVLTMCITCLPIITSRYYPLMCPLLRGSYLCSVVAATRQREPTRTSES